MREALTRLREDTEEQLHEAAVRHQLDVDALQVQHERHVETFRSSQDAVRGHVEELAGRLGHASRSLNLLALETEEVLQTGRARRGPLGRAIGAVTLPLRWVWIQRRAACHAVEAQHVMIRELAAMKSLLESLAHRLEDGDATTTRPETRGDRARDTRRRSGEPREHGAVLVTTAGDAGT